MAQGKKRANVDGYEQFTRSDGSKDWRPVPQRASEGNQIHSNLRADFASDTSHLDDIEDIDFYEDDLSEDVDELLNENLDQEVEKLLEEDLETGLTDYDDYSDYDDDYYDDDYKEGFGDYGDLSEKRSYDDDLGDYYSDEPSHGGYDSYDEWN